LVYFPSEKANLDSFSPLKSRKSGMSEFITFASALEGKIKEQLLKEQDSVKESLVYEEGIDYAHLAWLMGQVSQKKSQPLSPYRQYQAKPKPRKPHNLNETQSKAYDFLCALSPLNPGFTARELKNSYRQAVKIAHPDLGGTALTFAKVQEAYKVLKTLV
jgi:hypothetical protein